MSSPSPTATPPPLVDARRVVIVGRVQGVGFRPFVYNLASSLSVRGWVRNGAGQVEIHAEAPSAILDRFERELTLRSPPLSRIDRVRSDRCAVEGATRFQIVESRDDPDAEVHIPPDVGLCDDCRRELHDPRDRRHRYGFINCTQCGPRYTLILDLPYDRARTSMRDFELCEACEREYRDVSDRRFHAEPVACPSCGPELELRGDGMSIVGDDEAALERTLAVLRRGGIAAVKGIGGYHLLCDATNDDAVRRLRARKNRPTKPLAVMFPQPADAPLEVVGRYVDPSEAEADALLSPARPIVLVRSRPSALAESVAFGLDELGVMLPYTPLHELLLSGFGGPLVATSGNPSGEPLVTTPEDAESELSRVADVFLHHDRPIVRPVDDGVVRRIGEEVRTLRIGRGLAPLELELPRPVPEPVLAVGGHLKNTVAIAWGHRLVLSPHIGDLDGPRSVDAFADTATRLPQLFRMRPARILADAHPDYASARWARSRGLPVVDIPHHFAHAASLAGEHPDVDRWIVLTWDGVGLGPDGTLWGGEALTGRPGAWTRVASFRTFRIPGGVRAGREPWRSAVALAWEDDRDPPVPIPGDVALLRAAWSRGIAASTTSAAGRIFDAAASILLGLDSYGHEAQGPMQLEALATEEVEPVSLPLEPDPQGVLRSDWGPLVSALVGTRADPRRGASLLHSTLAQAAVDHVIAARARTGATHVGLSGGVFHNRVLTELIARELGALGFDVRLPRQIPAGDGGLAYGQVIEYLGSLDDR